MSSFQVHCGDVQRVNYVNCVIVQILYIAVVRLLSHCVPGGYGKHIHRPPFPDVWAVTFGVLLDDTAQKAALLHWMQ